MRITAADRLRILAADKKKITTELPKEEEKVVEEPQVIEAPTTPAVG